MVIATNEVSLFERVEEFLGSEATLTEVINAIGILKDKGFNYGDNINDFWPENMLDLINKVPLPESV
jgi:hypothetical protein